MTKKEIPYVPREVTNPKEVIPKSTGDTITTILESVWRNPDGTFKQVTKENIDRYVRVLRSAGLSDAADAVIRKFSENGLYKPSGKGSLDIDERLTNDASRAISSHGKYMVDLPGSKSDVKSIGKHTEFESGHLLPTMLVENNGPLANLIDPNTGKRIDFKHIPAAPMLKEFNHPTWFQIEKNFWKNEDGSFKPVTKESIGSWIKKLRENQVPENNIQEIIAFLKRLNLYD